MVSETLTGHCVHRQGKGPERKKEAEPENGGDEVWVRFV
jgi:hypothetical protein